MSKISEIAALYKQLKGQWGSHHPNLEKCEDLLDKLKQNLVYLSFLPVSITSADKRELMLARDVLEIGAKWSVSTQNLASFEQYMSQLKNYYFDYTKMLQNSSSRFELLGLNLLYLLSQNRVAEFHVELELLPQDIIRENKFIRHPVSIEQCLMEGSYNKIFQAKNNIPAKSYSFFMDILLDTIRNDIGECLEKAYEKISFQNAFRKLYFHSPEDLSAFAMKRNWRLGSDDYFIFASGSEKPQEPIPAYEAMIHAITYAQELQKIV